VRPNLFIVFSNSLMSRQQGPALVRRGECQADGVRLQVFGGMGVPLVIRRARRLSHTDARTVRALFWCQRLIANAPSPDNDDWLGRLTCLRRAE
jgi:hypothetical protein